MKRGKLIRARIKKGLSQKVAAELLGVSRNTWSLWELGKKDPYPVYVEKLCTFFYIKEPSDLNLEPPQLRTEQAQKRTSSHTPPQSLHTQTSYYDYSQQFLPQDSREQAAVPSLFPRTSDIIEAGENSKEPEGAAMDEGRRQLMRDAIGVTTTAMIAPASLFEQFARVLAKPSTIEKYHLSVLEQRTALLWQYRDDNILLPSELYRAISRETQHVVHLLESFPLPSIQVSLLALACKLFTLCSALLYALGAYEQAREPYSLAIQAATQAEQPLLEAIASTWMSFTWTYEHRYQEAAHQITQSLSLLTDPNVDRGTFA